MVLSEGFLGNCRLGVEFNQLRQWGFGFEIGSAIVCGFIIGDFPSIGDSDAVVKILRIDRFACGDRFLERSFELGRQIGLQFGIAQGFAQTLRALDWFCWLNLDFASGIEDNAKIADRLIGVGIVGGEFGQRCQLRLVGSCRPSGLKADDLAVLIDVDLEISWLVYFGASRPILAEISLELAFEKANLGRFGNNSRFDRGGTNGGWRRTCGWLGAG